LGKREKRKEEKKGSYHLQSEVRDMTAAAHVAKREKEEKKGS